MSIAAKNQEHDEPLSPSGTHPSKSIRRQDGQMKRRNEEDERVREAGDVRE